MRVKYQDAWHSNSILSSVLRKVSRRLTNVSLADYFLVLLENDKKQKSPGRKLRDS